MKWGFAFWVPFLLALDGAAMYGMGQGTYLIWGLVLHGICGLGLFLVFCGLYPGARGKALAWLAFLLLVGLPGLGIAAVMVLWGGIMLFARGHIVSKYNEYVSYTEHKRRRLGDIEEIDRDIEAQLQVQPLADILRGDDHLLKRSAIEKLGRRADQDAVALLNKAKFDPHPDIRFYATSALARIEEKINQQIQAAKDALAENMDQYEVLNRLGYCYYDYCYLGVLDEVTTRYYLELAIDAFQKSMDLNTDQPAVLLRLATAYLEMEDLKKSLRVLSLILAMNPKDKAARMWRAEVRYDMKDFEGVKEDCQELLAQGALPEKVRHAVDYWADQENAA